MDYQVNGIDDQLAFFRKDGCVLFLGDRGESHTQRYVTGWLDLDSGGGWSSGHYFSDRDAAARDFAYRILEVAR